MSKYDVGLYTDEELYEIVGYDPAKKEDLEGILIDMMKTYMYSRQQNDTKMFTFLGDIYTHFFDEGLIKPDNYNDNLPSTTTTLTAVSDEFTSQMYDVSKYTDTELYSLLNVSETATNSEKEAKLIQLLQTYKNGQTDQGKKMFKFYSDVYKRLFQNGPEETTQSQTTQSQTTQSQTTQSPTTQSQTTQSPQLPPAPVSESADVVEKVNYSKGLDYTPGKINPILKETYTRIISIDSQYRDEEYPSSTDFTLNITETLKDVVSLKLYAVQIPVTWYTISDTYGSNNFFLKPKNAENTLGIYSNPFHEYEVKFNAGNYDAIHLASELQSAIQNLGQKYPDVSFGTTSYAYNANTQKSTLTIDIQKVYNESYYDMILGTNTKILLDLSENIFINTFYSIPTKNTTDPLDISFLVTSANNTIQIIHYIGTDTLNTISIIIPLNESPTTVTRGMRDIAGALNEQMAAHPDLVNSGVQWDPVRTRYVWKIYLNRYTAQNVIDSKLRLTFPDPVSDPNNVTTNNGTSTGGGGLILYQNGFFFPPTPIYVAQYEGSTDLSFTRLVSIQGETVIFRPKVDISGGVYVANNSTANDIILNIPDNRSYTVTLLVENINRLIGTTPSLYGTALSLSTTTLNMSFNINTVYTTKDYSLVFFDIYSFAKCTAIYKNVTADSTLGYILGYKELAEYDMTKTNKGSSGLFLDADGNSTNNNYTYADIPNPNTAYTMNTIISLEGDSVMSIHMYNYFMIILDDFNQNHLNDGLVTVSKRDTSVTLPSYANRKSLKGCNAITGLPSSTTTFSTAGLTMNQVYSVGQILAAQNKARDVFNAGPFIKDMFALLPIKVTGPVYVEFGGTLQQQERVYFGPVNINRLQVKLINDKGNSVELNGANWSFQLVCEQLYQKGGSLV